MASNNSAKDITPRTPQIAPTQISSSQDSDVNTPDNTQHFAQNDSTPDTQLSQPGPSQEPAESAESSQDSYSPGTPTHDGERRRASSPKPQPEDVAVLHATFASNKPGPTSTQRVRSSKAPGLIKWQKVVQNVDLMTFAGVEHLGTTTGYKKVLAPGYSWLVGNKKMTVLAPFILSGGPLNAALIDAKLLDNNETIDESDVISMSVTDMFVNCSPSEFVFPVQHAAASAKAAKFVAKNASKLKVWKGLCEEKSPALALEEYRNQMKSCRQNPNPTRAPKQPASKKAPKPKRIVRNKTISTTTAKTVNRKRAKPRSSPYERRCVAAKRAAQTRKRNREEQQQFAGAVKQVVQEELRQWPAMTTMQKELRDFVKQLQTMKNDSHVTEELSQLKDRLDSLTSRVTKTDALVVKTADRVSNAVGTMTERLAAINERVVTKIPKISSNSNPASAMFPLQRPRGNLTPGMNPFGPYVQRAMMKAAMFDSMY